MTKDMLSNMCAHVPEDIGFVAEQAHDLGVALQNSHSRHHHKVIDKEVFMFWEGGVRVRRYARENHPPSPSRYGNSLMDNEVRILRAS